jgi:hypothetical protein
MPLHVGGWFYGDDHYQIQFDNNADFSSPEYDTVPVSFSQEGPISNRIAVYDLLPKAWLPSLGDQMDIPPDGVYYVRVQDITTDGLKSAWSDPITLELQLSYSSCSPSTDGPITYNFGWGSYTEDYPKLLSLTLDDQLPDPNQTVTVSVHMVVEPYHTQPANPLDPITEMVLDMATDHHDSSPVTLTLNSGTATDGVWQGQWTPDDTFCFRYRYIIKATNLAVSLWPFDIVIRDGDWVP